MSPMVHGTTTTTHVRRLARRLTLLEVEACRLHAALVTLQIVAARPRARGASPSRATSRPVVVWAEDEVHRAYA